MAAGGYNSCGLGISGIAVSQTKASSMELNQVGCGERESVSKQRGKASKFGGGGLKVSIIVEYHRSLAGSNLDNRRSIYPQLVIKRTKRAMG